ncbi:RNA polymerase subunit sigma-70 [Pedobacter yulinensis]|uniref:RNA polymerase subunit sigma-70 n=1 Tax=Pedobacter yulinensis TaxID=2126353 RepID=A0A2T3HHY3_9SPHI|nr:RNA polymerase sigma-70 factor [Pedobacter yulinensis]PST82047.1 RNA polymerase subunit sigma-70 [Pedobacter yulinensis]
MPEEKSFTDSALIALLKEGDHAAFKLIYDRYWAVLFLHARNLLRDADEAADVVQELFATLWTKSETIDLRTSLSAYLYRAVRNKVLDHMKHRKISQTYLDSIDAFMLEQHVTSCDLLREKELAAVIEREVNALPEKMRQVFLLSRRENLSYSHIASQLSISEHTVKSQISNALRILRARLGSSYLLLLCFLPL